MWCGINHSQDKKCTICGTPRKTKSLQGGVIVSEKSFIELELAKMKAERALLSRRIENMEESVVPPQGEPLIQGYTAENWQEIIDGGYLCEAKDCEDREWVPVILERIDTGDDTHPFKIKYSASSAVKDDEDHDWQEYCRPAQIKGVMRPIFVEPVDDDDARCVFFSESGTPLHSNIGWGYRFGCGQPNVAKYIEL